MSIVYKAKSKADFEVVLNMLYDYIKELHSVDNDVKIRSKKALKEEYMSDITDPDYTFYLIYDNNVSIGFAIIGTGSCCHPLGDIYINEFYIKPEYREMGYGKELFDGIISKFVPSKICMYILKNNTTAIKFWYSILNKQWEDISSRYYNDTPSNLLWFMFLKRK